MPIVTKPNTFTDKELIDANQTNQNFDSIYSLVNGNLDGANLASIALNDTTKFANEIVTQSKTKGVIYTQDLYSQSWVVAGGLASYSGSPANQIQVNTVTANVIQSDGSYRHVLIAGTTYTTSALSTTYYLDLQPDGTMSWNTAHSGQTGYLPLATVTTNGVGNVLVVSDVRMLSAGIAWINLSKVSSSLADLAVRSATDLTSGTLNVLRLPTAIPAPNIGNGDVDNTKLSFLNSVTSSVQIQLDAKIPLTQRAAANGVATLDSGAKIPIAQLPDAVVGALEYQGTWNASTNTPTLPSASASKGFYYVVNTAGTYNTIAFRVGDWVISEGNNWDRVANSDTVTTVFGRLGNVIANTNDYTWPQIDKTTSSLADLTTRSASALNSGTLPVAQVPTGIPAINIGTGAVDNTHLNYLQNVTSDIQAQINGVVSGSIPDGSVTNVKIATGIDAVKIGNGSVSNTEYQYLDGTLSPIQTQISQISINVKSAPYNAVGDGVADDTAAINAAITAAAGAKLFIPAGTYMVSTLNGANNIVIEGAGRDLVTLKRINNAVGNNSLLVFNGNSKFEIRGITFDGNKVNQTAGANSLSIIGCTDYIVENNRMINAKAASGYGSGLAISAGANQTNLKTSRIDNNWISDNGSDGFYLNKEWNIAAKGNTFKNNGGAGLNVLNLVFPPVADVSDGLMISKNYAIGNTGTGITISGYITGGVQGAPIYGISVPQSRRIVVEGNVCTGNGSYGIAFQGENGVVSGNVCELNSRNVSYAAGILFNASYSICSNNITRDNKTYGIDAGGTYESVISNNQIMFEGYTDNTPSTHLNIGASQNCIVSGNLIRMAGTNQSNGISYTGIDGDGTTPFPAVGALSQIKNNEIYFNSNALSVGIYVSRGAVMPIVASNTFISPGDINKALVCDVVPAIIKDNVYPNPAQGTSTPSVASAATLVIPDFAETMFVTGTTNITAIQSYSQSVYSGKVRDVIISNQGSGYSPSNKPTVVFTGGGGTGAAATAEIDNGGRMIGVKMTNNGTGYTSAPTISFTGGVGSGAAGSAVIGTANTDGREISILFQGVLTLTKGASLNLVSNLTTTTSTLLKLRGAYGNWYEISRAN